MHVCTFKGLQKQYFTLYWLKKNKYCTYHKRVNINHHQEHNIFGTMQKLFAKVSISFIHEDESKTKTGT